MILAAIPSPVCSPQKDDTILFVAAADKLGSVQLTRCAMNDQKVTVVWQRKLLGEGASIFDAKSLTGGRIALLIRNGSQMGLRVVNAKDGASFGPEINVDPSATSLGLIDGHPVLVTRKGLLHPRFSPSDVKGDISDYAGCLERGATSYAFAMDAEWDLSHGYIAIYRWTGGRPEETYRRDLEVGPYALALSGSRLIVLLSGGPTEIYNVASPSHPRFAAQFFRHADWVALATDFQASRFYGLKLSGEIQAHRFDDRKGFVAVSNAILGRPVNSARLFATRDGAVVCGDDGTIQLYQASGSALTPGGERKVGTGRVFFVESPTP